MQLQQLTYFVAVADTLHFTRAAARLSVAQPSLSQQIRALEDDLGERLFHRERGNVTLTVAGEVLLPIARRILADAETVRSEIRDLGELRRGRVRLGATPSLCTGLLPSMLATFRGRYPGIQLVIHEGGSRDLERELSQGALDLALIISSRHARDPQLSTVPLLEEELVAVSCRSGPRPVPRRRMRITELEGQPLAMFRRGYDLREFTVAACRDAGFEPTFAIEGGEMDAVLGFVEAGLGIAVVPSTVVADRFEVTPFAAPGLSRTIALAQRREVDPPRAAQALQDCILDYLRASAAAQSLPPGVRMLA
ncbi:LysR substrate-binding domain-containing protein [Jatrophihabitans telluris]|uniref:LysR substrate-binding domain-containing protein n=1 Tax=Jatrophihabitans telluris TaxID=2038343 RepID=A0ABY4QZE6_9ACTN|nr:LysR substrate-binding domain-containing protein [Jatrophihabitans telluris]UQX88482.1 LysR substrate-binding domain-containing protein [Jatrophihabitans telluris]